MKIIYIHQYFRTPEEGGAVRSYHLAKGLMEAGIEVEMVTAHNQDSYDQSWTDGIKVHYLPVPYDQNFGFARRVWAFLQFVRQAKKLIKKLSRPDLLYITSTPLTTGLIGLWAKRSLAIPYIFEVRDLWPEAPIQVGAIKNRFMIKQLVDLETEIYAQALKLVALSPGIGNHLKKYCPYKEIALIPNFSDLERFYPMEKDLELKNQLGLGEGLCFAYTGALGQVNAVDELLDFAKMAQMRKKNWNFLIMGEGSQKEILLEKSGRLQLRNTIFIPFGSKEKVNQVLSLADFAWVSFAHLPVLKTNSPNKFFDALAAGKPISVNHKGWVHELVQSYHLGLALLPGKWEKSFAKLEELEANPKEILQMGAMSRKLAETYFSKEIATRRLLDLVNPRGPKPIQDDEADSRIA